MRDEWQGGGRIVRRSWFGVSKNCLLMSSSFDITPLRKSSPFASRWTHRRSAWASSTSVAAHPEQLAGPRARTRIRPGVTTPRSTVMDAISVGIDVSKRELVIAVHPTGEQWTTATTPAAIGTVVTRLRALALQIIVVEATGGDGSTPGCPMGAGGGAVAGG